MVENKEVTRKVALRSSLALNNTPRPSYCCDIYGTATKTVSGLFSTLKYNQFFTLSNNNNNKGMVTVTNWPPDRFVVNTVFYIFLLLIWLLSVPFYTAAVVLEK